MIVTFLIRSFQAKKKKISLNKPIVFIVCALLFFLNTNAQNSKKDSLKTQLKLANTVEEQFKITVELIKLNTKTNPALALTYAEELVELANINKSDSLINKANLNLATVYLYLENFPKSLQYYFKVINNAQKDTDPDVLVSAYVNSGNIYVFKSDYKNGIAKYTKALDYLKAKTKLNFARKAGVLNNIGSLYKEIKEYSKAMVYLNEAIKLSKQINDQGNIANILNNQGQVYQHLGKNDLALQRYLEAMEIRKKTNDLTGLATSNFRLGQYYYSIKNFAIAEQYFKKITSTKNDSGSLSVISQASFYLYNIYKQQGKYKDALQSIEVHKNANDSLFNEARTRKITQLEMQFEFDRVQNQQKIKQREKDLYSWLIGITLVLSLAIISLLFFLQKNKAKRLHLEQNHLKLEKQNLEKDIELKDKELTTQVLHLVQKNELIDVISEKLVDIKSNMNTESQQQVQKVITDLQSNLQPELLKEFKLRFQHVHNDFFNTLNEKFPDLSPSELRLCAFLKLNLTTKEISAITNISPKSIEIARTRLRKKLNLTGTDTNLVTFLSQLEQASVHQNLQA
ncbi:tetratricopeptide repeat protein [Pedobacter borealis]|uniref:tetratricopeptide repeat protein n=1 Tax=Pedobacter borealis TaxID=475254 RepID=UPI0009F874C5|nr:tetratricopeptide repeat protein [Pedobacter borealis]